MSKAIAQSSKLLCFSLVFFAGTVAISSHSYAMRKCTWGAYTNGERCLHPSGKAVCEFNALAPQSDRAARWKCWDRKGARLYLKKNPRDGKYYLTYGRGGHRARRRRDPNF